MKDGHRPRQARLPAGPALGPRAAVHADDREVPLFGLPFPFGGDRDYHCYHYRYYRHRIIINITDQYYSYWW